MRRWWSPRVVSAAIGFAGLTFVGRLGWDRREELADTTADAEPWLLLVALLAGVAGMAVIGWVWCRIVVRFGAELRLVSAMRSFFVGQLGKYVPGGIWSIVGLGEGARQGGVPGRIAYAATLQSLATSYIAAAYVTLASVLAIGLPPNPVARLLSVAVLAVAVAGSLVLHPRLSAWASRAAAQLLKRNLDVPALPWRDALTFVLQQTVVWLLIGWSTWLVTEALGANISMSEIVRATSVAWTVGFLALPVPGGIGVRELVFVSMLDHEPIAAPAAIAARLLFVAVDVVGAAIATVWWAVARGGSRSSTV